MDEMQIYYNYIKLIFPGNGQAFFQQPQQRFTFTCTPSTTTSLKQSEFVTITQTKLLCQLDFWDLQASEFRFRLKAPLVISLLFYISI